MDKKEVVKGPRSTITIWNVIDGIMECDIEPTVEQFENLGRIVNFDFGAAKNRTMRDATEKYERNNFLSLLHHLWPGCDTEQLEKMNNQLEMDNVENEGKRKKSVRKIT